MQLSKLKLFVVPKDGSSSAPGGGSGNLSSFKSTITGNGVGTAFTISNPLLTTDVSISVLDPFGKRIYPDLSAISATQITIEFLPGLPPANGDIYTVLMEGTGVSGSGSSGSSIYNGQSPTDVTVGALPAGSVIAGLSYQAIIEQITNQIVLPTIGLTPFSLIEKGTSYIPTVAGTINPNEGTITARRVKRVTTVINSPGSNTVNFVDAAQTTNQTYSIEADYTTSAGSGTAVGSTSLNFEAPMFKGCGVPGLTQTQIKALAKTVESKAVKNLTYGVTSGQVFYFAYPASWGNLTSIKDENNFECLTDFTRRDETWTLADASNEAYKIYVFNTVQSAARTTNFIYTF